MKIGLGGGIGPVRGGVSTRGAGVGLGPFSAGCGGSGCGTILGFLLVIALAWLVVAWPWMLVHHLALAHGASQSWAKAQGWVAEIIYIVVVLGCLVLYGAKRPPTK
jgi:hypothetical protein